MADSFTDHAEIQSNPGSALTSSPESKRSWPPALFALAVGSFAIGTTEFLPAALLPTISSDLQVSASSAGLLISGYALGVTLTTPILSAFFSALPRKQVLMGLMALFAVTNALAACSPDYSFLMAMRFLSSFSHGVYFAVASLVAAGLAPKGRESQAISILFSGLTLAMATVVPLGALLGQILGWRAAFAATSLLGVASFVSIALTVPKLAGATHRLSLLKQMSALKSPRLLLALSMTAVGYAGTFVTLSYLAPFLEQVSGFHPVTVTFLFGLLGIGVTFGNLLGGKVASLGLFPALVGLYSLVAVSLLALWLIRETPELAIVALFSFSVFMFSPGAGLQLLALKEASLATPGTEDVAAGLNQSAFNLGIAAGAFLGGRVIDSSLGLSSVPLASIVLLVLAVGLTLWGWRTAPAGDEKYNPA